MSQRVWDRPANEKSRQLPAGMTLREWTLAEKASGRKWKDLGRQLGYEPNYLRQVVTHGVDIAPRRDDPPDEHDYTDRRPLKDWERQRVAAAYWFRSWSDYQNVKAAGLTVSEFKELAERRQA